MKSYKGIILSVMCLIVIKTFIRNNNNDEKAIFLKIENENELSGILSQFMEQKAIDAAFKDTATLLPKEIGTYMFKSGGNKIKGYMSIWNYQKLMNKEVLTAEEQSILHQINKNIIEKSASGVELFRNSIRGVLKTFNNSAEKVAFLNKTYSKLFDDQTFLVYKEKVKLLKATESGKPEPKFE